MNQPNETLTHSLPIHRQKLRRLRILQALSAVDDSPLGEQALLAQLRADPELSPTLDLVRLSIGQLAEYDLVEEISIDDHPWRAARLTATGWAFLRGDLNQDLNQDLGDLNLYQPDYVCLHVTSNRGGRVSSVQRLPTEVKAWLDQELIKHGFAQYTALTKHLKQRGWELSRSAIARYGKQVKEERQRLKQTVEISRAFAEVVGDDQAAMAQGLTAILQQEIIELVRNQQYNTDDISLPKLIQATASLNKTDLQLKQHVAKVRQTALQEAAAAVESQVSTQAGLTADMAEQIKAQILGL
jgi:hypothetical protein